MKAGGIIMKKLIYLTITCILLLSLSSPINAQVGLKKVAQSTMNFLLVGVAPRASAMGEAYCAFGTGAESIFFNPAGIAQSTHRFELQTYNTRWIADINYLAGSFIWNLHQYGTLGLSMLSVDYGTIYGTSLLSAADKDLYPAGYIDLGNVDNVGAYAFGLTYGRAISTQFLIGGSVRLVGQNLGQSQMADGLKDNNAVKLAFDAGVKYLTDFKSFRFAMSIRNFSSNIKREEIDEQLPLLFTMGVAMDLLDVIAPPFSQNNSLNLAVDFQHPNNYSERINYGLEYLLFDQFAIRAGYQTNQDLASWSLGLGINANIIGSTVQFDYSYSDFDLFDGVNRFSIGIAF
jgi:hypothetical protein